MDNTDEIYLIVPPHGQQPRYTTALSKAEAWAKIGSNVFRLNGGGEPLVELIDGVWLTMYNADEDEED